MKSWFLFCILFCIFFGGKLSIAISVSNEFFWKILDTIFFLLYRPLFKNLLMLRDKGILRWCPRSWRLLSLGWYFLCFWGSDTRLALNEQSRCRGDVLFPSRYSKTPRSPVGPVTPGWPFLKGLHFLLFPNIPYFLLKAKFPHIPVYLLPFVMYLHLVARVFFCYFLNNLNSF